MSIFGKIKSALVKPKTAETSSANVPKTDWDGLEKQVPFAGDQVPEDPESKHRRRLQRQGDNLIKMYFQGPEGYNDKTPVSSSMRNTFYDRLSNKTIKDADKSEILQYINLPSGPAEHPNFQKVFNTVNDRHGVTFLSTMLNIPDTAVSAGSLATFLNSCPTPVEFKHQSDAFLQKLIDWGNDQLKINEYEDDLKIFQEKIYGKRYEYYEALEYLQEQMQERNRARANAKAAASREAKKHDPNLGVVSDEHLDRMRQALDGSNYASPEEHQFIDPNNQP